jgi:hypothetical protein
MRTKRSTESKKTTTRAARAKTAAVAVKRSTHTPWVVAGVDGLSLAIAGVVIVAAGILVAAYRPASADETSARVEATAAAPPADAIESRQTSSAAPAKSAIDTPISAAGRTAWPAPLTITGCLDRDGDSYRLTDAAGTGLPKSRSWKSGFLKKNASSITVVDGDRHARLQDHLGQRVTVTGTMVNREMQIGSMRLLSESCSDKTKI